MNSEMLPSGTSLGSAWCALGDRILNIPGRIIIYINDNNKQNDNECIEQFIMRFDLLPVEISTKVNTRYEKRRLTV